MFRATTLSAGAAASSAHATSAAQGRALGERTAAANTASAAAPTATPTATLAPGYTARPWTSCAISAKPKPAGSGRSTRVASIPRDAATRAAAEANPSDPGAWGPASGSHARRHAKTAPTDAAAAAALRSPSRRAGSAPAHASTASSTGSAAALSFDSVASAA